MATEKGSDFSDRKHELLREWPLVVKAKCVEGLRYLESAFRSSKKPAAQVREMAAIA
jgi:hypothetical protein